MNHDQATSWVGETGFESIKRSSFRRGRQVLKWVRVVSIIVLTYLIFRPAGAAAQSADHRSAFGEPRATIMESLVKRLYPGVAFQWSPQLKVLPSGQPAQQVQFPGFGFQAVGNTLKGATGIEIGNTKARFVFDAQHHNVQDNQAFPTRIVVFVAAFNGQITQMKQSLLDPTDPLTEIKLIDIKNWPAGSWPTLQVQYISHSVAAGSLTSIEWQGVYDSNLEAFVNRVPLGITTTSKDGKEQTFMFSVIAASGGLQFTDVLSGKSIVYQCSDSCVVDGPTLLNQWFQ